MSDAIEFEVGGELPLKGEARSMLSPTHPHAPRVRALLEAARDANQRDGFAGFGTRRVGLELVMRPVGGLKGDVTNALGGIGDSLQSRRTNIDLTYLGELAKTRSSSPTIRRYARCTTGRSRASLATASGSGAFRACFLWTPRCPPRQLDIEEVTAQPAP